MKKIICLVILFLLFQLNVLRALAIYDPSSLPNNRFGIHIVEPKDLEAAAKLVNSEKLHDGDWGYLTLVIQDNDRDLKKWTEIFNQIRLFHLIPIVRLATHGQEGETWAKPAVEDIDTWVEFLDKLPWPIKNRYVVLFNEPNHAKEWGGALAPDEYAKIANLFIDKFHQKSDQFFVLPAGFDVYADGIGGTMEATNYWRLMEKHEPGIFPKFDGWSSHSYPKNNFSGSPWGTGRYSISGYRWEINYLTQNFGTKSDLPVFITETGWSQKPGLSREKIAEYFKVAYSQVWEDEHIVAVTPFLLNYPAEPFLRFSWKKPGGDGFFPQYTVIQELVKTAGEPLLRPFSKLGEIMIEEREAKLAKKQRYQVFSNRKVKE